MARNTSIVLGDHFEGFVDRQLASGRYSSASELLRAGLRLLEEQEQQVAALREALIDGERSGDAGVLNMPDLIREARREEGLDD
jgi:antitoxin ParD1/3/4